MDGQQLRNMAVQTRRYLVLRLLIDKSYNIQVFWHKLRRAWRHTQPLKFWDLDENIPLAKFTSIKDKKSIIRDGPWSFDKHMVLFSKVDGSKQVQQLKFHITHLWVRLHYLSICTRKEHASRAIGNSFGEVLEVDTDED